jgi:adenylate cyclase
MAAVIHRNGGTLDKFIGDGIMALFGAPNTLADPERSAMECAHEMLLELRSLNQELEAEGRAPLAIGVGINAGDVIVGNIGAGERHEYTAIGDTVNTAARLEALCKVVAYPIVCSEQIWQSLGRPNFLVDCGDQVLKGRSDMRVYGWNPVGG